jgi:hypothetical protein
MTARRPGFSYCVTASLVFLILTIALAASAQESQQSVSRWEVFGGYSYMRFDSQSIGFKNQSNLNGGEISGLFNITRRYSVFADTSANFGNEIKLYNFTIGPKASYRRKNDTFFIRGIFGKNRDQVSADGGKTSIGLVYGGGVGYDRHYSDRLDIRFLQVDYLNADSYGATQKNVRVSVGVVYRFGGK